MGKVTTKTTVYKKGDLIFAKIKGSPYWPARVESTPKDLIAKKKYNIIFYGTYDTSICKVENLEPYNDDTKTAYSQPRKLKGWCEALWEIEHDPQLKKNRQAKTSTQEAVKEEPKQQQQQMEESGDDSELGVNEEQDVKTPSTCKSGDSSGLANEEDSNELSSEESKSLGSRKSMRKSNRVQLKDDEQADSTVKTVVVKNVSPKLKQEIDESSNDSSQRATRRSVRTLSRKDDQLNDSNESLKGVEKSPDVADLNLSESTKRRSSKQGAVGEEKNANQSQPKAATRKSTNKKTKAVTKDELAKEIKEETSTQEQVKMEISTEENIIDSVDEKMDTAEQLKVEKSAEVPTEAGIKADKVKEAKANEENKNETQAVKSPGTSPLVVNKLPVFPDPKSIEEKKQKWRNMTPAERLAEKAALKAKKNLEKKKAFIKSIQIQDALLKMNNQIKISLIVAHQDVERCCFIMEDLLKLPFKQRHLFNTPEIVETIRKVTKFKDQKVKHLATECFNKFRYMFPVNQNDSFTSMFEKEREKFLAENIEELKKERAIASQLAEMLSNLNKRKAVYVKVNKDMSHEAKRLKTQKSLG